MATSVHDVFELIHNGVVVDEYESSMRARIGAKKQGITDYEIKPRTRVTTSKGSYLMKETV
jgi:hypothetical protein